MIPSPYTRLYLSPDFIYPSDWRYHVDTTESDLLVRRAFVRAMGGRT